MKALAVPWITVRGQNAGEPDGKSRVECTHCRVVLLVPGNYPSERFQGLLMGFEIDHKECEKR